MSPLTRRSLIATLGLGAGATAAGVLAPTAAFASSPSRSFSTLVFDEQFKDGSDFNAARWREKEPKGDTYLDYDWGVVTHDTHSVSGGAGHLFWRKRSTPKTGWQNRYDTGRTVRRVNEAWLTTEGLFSFVYGAVEVRARFPQQNLGLWAGVWLRPDRGATGGDLRGRPSQRSRRVDGPLRPVREEQERQGYQQQAELERLAHLPDGEDSRTHHVLLRQPAIPRGTANQPQPARLRSLLRRQHPLPPPSHYADGERLLGTAGHQELQGSAVRRRLPAGPLHGLAGQ